MARRHNPLKLFPNVTAYIDRHGKHRYRFRKKGLPTVYLPGLPGSREFAEAYEAASSGAAGLVIGQGRTKPGTLNALAVSAYASSEWAALAPTTRSNYRGVMERLRRDHGDHLVRAVSPAVILALRDRVEGPAAKSNLIKVLRWFLAYAVDRNLRPDNPALLVKKISYRTTGWHTWTEAEVVAFEARWPVGTKQRLAMDLLLHTGQRSQDVRLMGHQSVTDGHIRVVQSKTGTEMEIPIHRRLAESLATVPANQMLFLPTQYGPPYSAKGFYNWMKAACRAAGVPECSPHGLRKCIAVRLADAGCSHSEIMAITGHKNAEEVDVYIQARNQKRLAGGAMAKIGMEGERHLATPTDRLANGDSK